MTPDAFRAELARLGLSQVGAARFLEVDPRTVRRWAAGEVIIPKAVEMLLARLRPEEVRR
jgi:DNA-binding transcriptional regulator YiaG